MTDKPLHVLIAEKQALIALEIEVLLTEAAGCNITVCLPRDMSSKLLEARYDVVLTDATIIPRHNRAQFDLIREHGAGAVFLTSFDDVPGLSQAEPGFASLMKPFDEQRLLAAVFAAAKREPQAPAIDGVDGGDTGNRHGQGA